MGIASYDQPSFLKEAQLEILATGFEWASETLGILSWVSLMLAGSLRELMKARGIFAKGSVPLDYESFLPKVREAFDSEFADVMSRATVVQFQPGKVWLRFKNMADELVAYWRKREITELLTSVYGCEFKIRVGAQKV